MTFYTDGAFEVVIASHMATLAALQYYLSSKDYSNYPKRRSKPIS